MSGTDLANIRGKAGRPPVSAWGLIDALGALLALLTLAGFASSAGWLPELTSHFRVQYFAGLAVVAAVQAAGRRWGVSAACAACAGLNLWVIAPYLPLRQATPASGRPTLRLLVLNVHTANTRYDLVRRVVRDSDPELILFEEVDARWLRELKGLRDTHPHTLEAPRDDNFGMALFSKRPLSNPSILELGRERLPSIAAQVSVEDASFGFLGTHPLPPSNPGQLRRRDEQLAAVERYVAGRPGPFVLAGDLNLTPWASRFRRLVRETALVDTGKGWGIRGTWPAGLPLMRIAIDHVLVSENLRVLRRVTGPDVGSDHFPVLIELALDR